MAGLDQNPYVDPVTGLPTTGTTAPWIGSQEQVDDSVANQVAALSSQDSKLNQMAKTEGLKAANSRGLLNSSMAVGAAQDAVLQNVIPIASQDASQAFQKNMAATGFEYDMTAQESQQQFQAGEAVAQRGWQTAENLSQQSFLATQADLDRVLQESLQSNQITADMALQVQQIASTEGMEAARLKLQEDLFEQDIAFRMSEGQLDREAAVAQQQADIAFQTAQNALTRDLEAAIANMNLSATQQQGASDAVSSTETMYQAMYNSIMSNPDLSSTDRASQLTSAANLRQNMLSMVEQMYAIDL
ncbi:MAG TPA: hypothetical protein VIT67_00460, partial [Povalibacter sp.]